jgi:hypothetical protein
MSALPIRDAAWLWCHQLPKTTRPVLRGASFMPAFFLAGGGLSSGGGLAGVGDLLAGVSAFGGGWRAHFPVCSGIVPGHFSDEGFEIVVAA